MIAERSRTQISKTTSNEQYPARAKTPEVNRQSFRRYSGTRNVQRPWCWAIRALVISLWETVSC